MQCKIIMSTCKVNKSTFNTTLYNYFVMQEKCYHALCNSCMVIFSFMFVPLGIHAACWHDILQVDIIYRVVAFRMQKYATHASQFVIKKLTQASKERSQTKTYLKEKDRNLALHEKSIYEHKVIVVYIVHIYIYTYRYWCIIHLISIKRS